MSASQYCMQASRGAVVSNPTPPLCKSPAQVTWDKASYSKCLHNRGRMPQASNRFRASAREAQTASHTVGFVMLYNSAQSHGNARAMRM
eukprot:CAMPEP_0198613856 /NCGR_PEP_ID=MMETSP1462-20131121/158604_1 /TAXON_ID=1333877 /ORGANISM="Brandtodinium nutriculum, Strain RCC3387" /LENGTH=88 /DNA_ID=CAMNT_0044345659 /DNA_START=591 /DNA_END=857 /DNA_ORIENTATION=-